MGSSIISPGFMGAAKIAGNFVRCTDLSLSLEQDVLFYNHIYGLRDTMSTNSSTKGEKSKTTEDININKKFMRPSVKLTKGSISFPVTETCGFAEIFKNAKFAKECEMEIIYDCDNGYRVKNCIIDSFSLSCSGGDIAQANLSFVGKSYTFVGKSYTSIKGVETVSSDKIVTWDQFIVNFAEIDGYMQNFNLSITNPCIPIYTSGANNKENLFPKDIRIGVQEVNGSITYFGNRGKIVPLSKDTDINNIKIAIDGIGFSETISAILKPISPKGGVKYPTTTLSFIGAGSVWN